MFMTQNLKQCRKSTSGKLYSNSFICVISSYVLFSWVLTLINSLEILRLWILSVDCTFFGVLTYGNSGINCGWYKSYLGYNPWYCVGWFYKQAFQKNDGALLSWLHFHWIPTISKHFSFWFRLFSPHWLSMFISLFGISQLNFFVWSDYILQIFSRSTS